jgi:hypothetical protein
MPFVVIDPAVMTNQPREHQITANKCHECLAGNFVAEKLKAIVTNSARLVPLITDLKNFPIAQLLVE